MEGFLFADLIIWFKPRTLAKCAAVGTVIVLAGAIGVHWEPFGEIAISLIISGGGLALISLFVFVVRGLVRFIDRFEKEVRKPKT